MSSAAVGTHSGAGPLSLMSCVRESSPLQDYELDGEKNVATKKQRFWNPKKWFKRKAKENDHVALPSDSSEKDVLRSRSTSELSIAEEQTRRRSGGSAMHPGLSVSHDSVFHSPNSGSDMELDQAQSSSSLSISQPQMDLRLQTELSERLRLRRGRGDTSEDDEGLPHSPCNSPTTTDHHPHHHHHALLDKTANSIIKDLPTKSHSTCSDGSLLSMDSSSEMDEESFGQQSRHSSKLSLHEKKISDQDDDDDDLELGGSATSTTPLNHSAAHHRVSVRPKRRAPHRSKRTTQLSTALPTTPEVNEDSSVRSMSPESISREAVTELYTATTTTSSSTTSILTTPILMTEHQLKCSSLPPGLAPPPNDYMEDSKLNRSRSNAGTCKSQDHFSALEEDASGEKEEKSFFDRIFPRRSAKKRKSKEEKSSAEKFFKEEKIQAVSAINSVVAGQALKEQQSVAYTSRQSIESTHASSYHKRVESKPIAAPRTGAASRQRVIPRDIPSSPDAKHLRKDFGEQILAKPSPEKSFAGTSPLQAELENRFKQRQTVSSSPPKPTAIVVESPPLSPNKIQVLPQSVISKTENLQFFSTDISSVSSSTTNRHTTETKRETTRSEEIRSKAKIPGLSSLQQRVLSLSDSIDEVDDHQNGGFKSLTDFPDESAKIVKPVAKSQSFKSTSKPSTVFDLSAGQIPNRSASDTSNSDNKKSVLLPKASSLDMVKHLDEPLKSDVENDKIQQEVTADKKSGKSENNEYCFETKTDLKEPASPAATKSADRIVLDDFEEKSFHKSEDREEETAVVPHTLNLEDLGFTESDCITISGPSHTAVVNVSSNTTNTYNTSSSRTETNQDRTKEVTTKESVSVTKIQLKRETTQVTQSTVTMPRSAVPEFLSRQLNKVETRPLSNVVLSMNTTTQPRIIDEQSRPKTLLNLNVVDLETPQNSVRKFSQEDLEIIEKTDDSDSSLAVLPPLVTITSMTALAQPQPNRFKKNELGTKLRKAATTPESPKREKPMLRSRSVSLDSLKNDASLAPVDSSDKSSQDSLDRLDEKVEDDLSTTSGDSRGGDKASSGAESVVLRKKSLVKQKADEEPELMKVFARRSLKLKDNDSEQISQQITSMLSGVSDNNNAPVVATENVKTTTKDSSDKENQDTDSSPKERKRSVTKEFGSVKLKQPLAETKASLPTTTVTPDAELRAPSAVESVPVVKTKDNKDAVNSVNKTKEKESTAEITFRKPIHVSANNNSTSLFTPYQRSINTVSLSSPKTELNEQDKVRKQSSFAERRKTTDSWIKNERDGDHNVVGVLERKISQDEIITSISPKTSGGLLNAAAEFLTEAKNFNQRKAEWEKRAQEAAQKKTVP